ncbi:Bicarbonate transport ATP-binding protein CmpC [Serratia fonticola]|uniref:Bicarbonate transport ATP-binding protein CmpC n=1 Tax=Serratia fonticola TaxID=47917 RepID=A0A4V6KX18_SERFO|nr:Bicarbonate transport ATP-binding protein CmpC [Serratia fonticola]
MRIFAGLIFPDTGTVSLAGKPIEGPDTDISMVFQSYALYPWLTVYDNIALACSHKTCHRN